MRHAASLALLILSALPAAAEMAVLDDLRIERPMLRETPPNAPVGAGYLSIVNTGATDDVLVSARIAADVAEAVQLHQMTMAEGVMTMVEVENGVPLPAGETVRLAPGGHHLMLAGLRRPLVAGDSHAVILRFAEAGEITLDMPVVTAGEIRAADRGAAGHGGSGQDHGTHATAGN